MNDRLCWESKYQTCIYSASLLKKIYLQNEAANNKVDLLQIKKAIYYAKKYHGSQKRLSGEPYYSHPLKVAELVAPYCFKTDILVTSILHDTIEDTNLTKDMLAYIFDSNIASKVEDLTRVKFDRKISSAEMVKLLYSSKKYDLLLIKMFDRVHNMQTINYKSVEKSKKIIDETLKSFLTLSAHFRLNTLQNIDVEEQITQLCYQNISKTLTTNDLDFFLENCFFQLPPLQEFQND